MTDPVVSTNEAMTIPNTLQLYSMSQHLNNQGCLLIEMGDYSAAVIHLKRALELTRAGLSGEQEQVCCECQCCSMSSYVPNPSDAVTSSCEEEREVECDMRDVDCQTEPLHSCNGAQRRRRTRISIESETSSIPQETNHTEEGFVYRQPIWCNQHNGVCRHIGTTMSFVVLFNIALSHHLKAIEMIPHLNEGNDTNSVLQQPLKLYELAYQLNSRCQERSERSPSVAEQQPESQLRRRPESRDESCEEEDPATRRFSSHLVNLRIMMLITNNISQIHKLAGNETKHHQCLEHLLNAVMYICNQNQAMASGNSQQQTHSVFSPSERDGIFENLSLILNTKVYAAAA